MTHSIFCNSKFWNFVRRLKENPEIEETLLWEHNIRLRHANLGGEIAGFTYYSRKGYFYLVLNSLLSPEYYRFVFWHEIYHIICEKPADEKPYLIRLDLSHEEVTADVLAEMAQSYVVNS